MNPVVQETQTIDIKPRPEPQDWSPYPLRPPVVTIMGHVDHGKTTLLDSLRKTSVAAGEAGGITQHIGAFSVLLPTGPRITFLDTPGHAAFSAMRERGAQTTDIVVLVVAADDGVMPQTVEAIKHAQAANVPLIVALNKCDKPGVNTKKVKEGLLRHNIVLEEFGGEIPAVEVSGLTGKGLDELEETILTLSEVLDMRGDPDGLCEATVVEAKLNRERGNVATVLVRRGTLRPGSVLVAGNVWCKVRRLLDENGSEVEQAGPSTPVEVMGWKELPQAGDSVLQAESEQLAKRVVQSRKRHAEYLAGIEAIETMNQKRMQEKAIRAEAADGSAEAGSGPATAAAEAFKAASDGKKELRLILKADVHGTLEALEGVLQGLPSHEIQATAVSAGVGAVTDSDIQMAIATGARILAFNVPCERRILNEAASHRVVIRQHNIIYKLIDDVKEMMCDELPPELIDEVLGEADVLQIFHINVKGKITEPVAGCRVTNGKVMRSHKVRIVRDGATLYTGSLKTFKHHKKDVNEASKGLECGMALDGFTDYRVGDVIQAFQTNERRRTIS
ncbi:P-loop containing nucleoside triphosphate hydrolase protein [Entophlyctis helioformis]|nr:P-loop containing nucleoside triphosphate hydrolase protein [Entophlyctis helioformis]